jgi:F1F0 ATPase subunit 2
MEWVKISILLMTGFTLGVLHFGGLWFTVQKINSSKYPALWMISSFLFRIGLLLITFYWLVMMSGWYLAVAFIGFLMARTILIKRIKPAEKQRSGEEYGI